ncbi:MAG: Glutamate--cysteine ligase EgtA [Candidatus Omnitrophica bacterium]|nr:Glutamate--cysteine ligase EgtA [Candidatus Omnitrophota bacterium]
MPVAHRTPKRLLRALKAEILAGCKHPDQRRIGVEWEKLGVRGDTGKALRYYGPGGVASLFRALIVRHGWTADQRDRGHIVALRKGFTRITLEPGGQIELSGGPAYCLRENARELDEHLREIRSVGRPHGIVWLGLGCQPISAEASIPWVPKQRYGIMRRLLRRRGRLTYSMMKRTASLQASFDFISEQDAVDKYRLATLLSPFLTAMLANSPFSEGRPSGYLSYRAHIWRHTDPARSGVLRAALRRDFTIDDYVNYALDVPMFFVQRGGELVSVRPATFRQYLRRGCGHLTACREDWQLHLSTIFTDARLKTYLEVRSIDCPPPSLSLAAPTLLKGLLYAPTASRRALKMLERIDTDHYAALYRRSPREGLDTRVGRRPAREYALELLRLAASGLSEISASRCGERDDKTYLEPLVELLVDRGINPAQALLRDWEAGGRRDLLGILRRHCAYA